MSTKIIKSPYVPRPHQQEMRTKMKRFNVFVMHRRAGKTFFCVNTIGEKLLTCDLKNPQAAYIAPEKSQAKRITWKYFKDCLGFIPGIRFFETELKVEFPVPNGSTATIYIEGAEEIDRLRGLYFDMVVLDEVAQMPRNIWSEVLLPALSDRKGEAIFIGTPQGRNFFYELYERGLSGKDNWFSMILPVSKSGVFTEEEANSFRDEMGQELYNQEYECDFNATFSGSFFGKQIVQMRQEGRIGYFPYDNRFPVVTAWDLGTADKTVIWFAQYINGNIYIVDYFEDADQTTDHYINILKRKGYSYSYCILPHDAKQRWGSRLTRVGEISAAGFHTYVLGRVAVIEGINAGRAIFPKCYFNKNTTEMGLNSLFTYKAKSNPTFGVQKTEEVHDEHSHAGAAWRYLALGLKESMMKPAFLQKEDNDFENPDKKFFYEAYNPLDNSF